MIIGKLFPAILILVAAVVAQEDYLQWSYCKNIFLNTTSSGAGVPVTQNKFPVLVRLTSANADVFTGSQGAGADIRFTKWNGTTRIPHQVEWWDAANQSAGIWVLVDTILGNSNAQFFRMYWGRVGSADSSRGRAVFDTGNGFQGVWHFGEDPTASALDATANGFAAAPNGSVSVAAGPIGNGKGFDGSTAYYSVANSATGKLDFPEFGNYTISAWAYTNVLDNAHHEIVSKNDYQYALKLYNANEWEFFEYNGGVGWNGVRTAATSGVWTHLLGVRSGTNSSLYVNGALASNSILLADQGLARATDTEVSIGKRGDNATRYWNGMLDEVRMSNVARSDAWAKLEYENQKTPQTLVSLGVTATPATVGVKAAGSKAGESFSAASAGGRILFQLPAVAGNATLSVVDLRGRPVWSRKLETGMLGRELAWDGKASDGHSIGAGLYVVRLKVTAETGASAVFERKVTYSP